MTLNFPNRYVWLLIAGVILILLHGGCQPIQPPTTDAPAAPTTAEARADLSTSISVESRSPDGNWIATNLVQFPRGSDAYHQNFVVAHVSGAPIHTILDRDFPGGLGYKVAEPLMWSKDSARFYYTNRPQADGCGLMFNGADLYVLDLTSGISTELLPAGKTATLGLSPDELKLAYLAIGEPTLLIQEIDSGEVTTFDLAALLTAGPNEARPQVGAFVWSPDNRTLAFIVAHNPCIGSWAQATSLYTLDTVTMALTSHLAKDARILSPVAWIDESTLLVENQLPFDQLDQKQQFHLDLTTNEVTPVE